MEPKKLAVEELRLREFEAASSSGGKLYFTSTGLIANVVGSRHSRFDAGFVSDDGAHIYCFRSPFAAERQANSAQDIRDIAFFRVLHGAYPGVEEREHYQVLVQHLCTGDGLNDWFFDDPKKLKARCTWRQFLLYNGTRLFSWCWRKLWKKDKKGWQLWAERGLAVLSFIAVFLLFVGIAVDDSEVIKAQLSHLASVFFKVCGS